MAYEGWETQLESAIPEVTARVIPAMNSCLGCSKNRLSIVKLLLKHQAPLSRPCAYIARHGSDEIMLLLLNHLISSKNPCWGPCVTNYFCLGGLFHQKRDKIELIFYEDCELGVSDYLAAFLKNFAFEMRYKHKNSSPVIDTLFEYVFTISEEIDSSLLFYACTIENDERALKYVEKLVEKGAALDRNAAPRALETGNYKTLQFLVKKGFSVEFLKLEDAVCYEMTEIVEAILQSNNIIPSGIFKLPMKPIYRNDRE